MASGSGFGKWAIGQEQFPAGRVRKGYEPGAHYWISAFGQSMQKKEAYADAFAKALRAAGIECHAGSRMD